MGEHIGRYDDLIKTLNENGITVSGFNYFGHGENTPLGVMEPSMIDVILDSTLESHQILKEEFSCNKIIHFGHSLGTYFTRLLIDQIEVDQVILSGSAYIDSKKIGLTKALVGIISKVISHHKTHQWILNLVFNDLNKPFGNKTGYDFVSSMDEEIQKYGNDPLCSFPISIGFAELLIEVSQRVIEKEEKLININVPIILASGNEDPVGLMGKAVIELGEYSESINSNTTEVILYNSRHEVLHDLDSKKMKGDILKRVLA
jgi:alpha-beta hydrolase superfamily lysophospholipase